MAMPADENVGPELEIEVAEQVRKEHCAGHGSNDGPEKAAGKVGNGNCYKSRNQHEPVHCDVEDSGFEGEQASESGERQRGGDPDDGGDQAEVEYVAHFPALPA